MNGGWIGVDLDGTLAHYDKWHGVEHIGEPIPKMVKRVKRWLSEGKEVRIFTARMCRLKSLIPEEQEEGVQCIHAIHKWCEKHIGRRLQVTNEKDFGMIELWDDRCVQVVPNTGMPIDLNYV